MTDLPSWCRVGAKVVCVDVSKKAGFSLPPEGLTCGEIYTISGLRAFRFSGNLGVCLKEAGEKSPTANPFLISRFRPLTSTKTEAEDLAYFKQFLQSSIETSHWKQEERVDD